MIISIYQRISKTVVDIGTIPTALQSGVRVTLQIYIFQKMLLPFPSFPGGLENTYGQCSRKL